MKTYRIRFWYSYKEFIHEFDVNEFMDDVFGYTFSKFYFECEIYNMIYECCIDTKEMSLTITPLANDGETLLTDRREVFDERFWIIERIKNE